MKKPKIYFIQIGFEAKLKSLSVIEVLRKAHIPIIQSLSVDLAVRPACDCGENSGPVCHHLRSKRSNGPNPHRAQYGKSLAGDGEVGEIVGIYKAH